MPDLDSINLHSLITLAANINRSSCHLQYRWRIRPTRLRKMSAWMGYPAPSLRRIQDHAQLSTYLALLATCDFVKENDRSLRLTRAFMNWLDLPFVEKIQSMSNSLDSAGRWRNAITRYHLQAVLTDIDRLKVASHLVTLSPTHTDACELHSFENYCRILLPRNSDLQTMFHLLHFCDWISVHELRLTPISVSHGLNRGYTSERMVSIITAAQRQPLPSSLLLQLKTWFAAHGSYEITPVLLLQTRSPNQLADLMMQKRFRRHVFRLISPRHAIISYNLIPNLKRWLELQRTALVLPIGMDGSGKSTIDIDANPQIWIALRVFFGLEEFIPLKFSALGGTIEDVSAAFTDQEIGELERAAQSVLADIRRVVQGQDAFFPSEKPVADRFIELIESAIVNDGCLSITYKGLGDLEPRQRIITPLWLESRGNLHYLHAYCYLAEAERTFRVDRMIDIQIAALDDDSHLKHSSDN